MPVQGYTQTGSKVIKPSFARRDPSTGNSDEYHRPKKSADIVRFGANRVPKNKIEST